MCEIMNDNMHVLAVQQIFSVSEKELNFYLNLHKYDFYKIIRTSGSWKENEVACIFSIAFLLLLAPEGNSNLAGPIS